VSRHCWPGSIASDRRFEAELGANECFKALRAGDPKPQWTAALGYLKFEGEEWAAASFERYPFGCREEGFGRQTEGVAIFQLAAFLNWTMIDLNSLLRRS